MTTITRTLIVLFLIAFVAAPFAKEAASMDSAERSVLFLDQGELTEESVDDLSSAQEVLFAGNLRPSAKSFELSRKFSVSAQDGVGDEYDDQDVQVGSVDMPGKKNPGKAIILSAIIPGAGQYYAESKWKAAAFLAAEVACWVGVVSYAKKGKDKEDEYEAYANDNWDKVHYQDIEFDLAQVYNTNDTFTGNREEWDNLPWGGKPGDNNDKQDYLPGNFTHELPTTTTQQYYEMIGKYLTQFGWGWQLNNETYAELDDFEELGIWRGTSSMASDYIGMRGKSNDYLDTSATFSMIVMANHVLSALDAGFTVRMYNKKLAEAQMGVKPIQVNGTMYAGGGLNFTF